MKRKLRSVPFAMGYLLPSLALAICEAYEPVPLTEGVTVENLQGEINHGIYFSIEAPTGGEDLSIETSGGTGDADLYVLHGSLPSRGNASELSELAGNGEQILIVDPDPGKYYILVYGYEAFSGLSLTATYTSTIQIVELTGGSSVDNLAANVGEELLFKIESDGNSDILINTSGGTGDVDVYARYGNIVSPGTVEFTGRGSLNEEELRIRLPQVGTYYITLVAEESFSGVTLSASYAGLTPVTQLNGNTTVNGLSAGNDESLFYMIDSPGDGRDITISTSGSNGDLDLFVREGTLPTAFSFDFFSETSSSDEQVIVIAPPAGAKYFIELYAFAAFSNVTLSTEYTSSPPIPSINIGESLSNLAAALEDSLYFKVQVPAGQCALSVTTSGGTGDLDLYVQKDGLPTRLQYIEFGENDLSNEEVIIPSPEAGTYFIRLFAFEEFAGATLSVSTTADPDYSPWTGAETFPNGWSHLEWFGYFTQETQGWMYHLEHGFLYYPGTAANGIVLFDMATETWFWTSETIYPGLFKFGSDQGWYWYLSGSQSGNRRFIRLSDGLTVHETDW